MAPESRVLGLILSTLLGVRSSLGFNALVPDVPLHLLPKRFLLG